MHGWSVAVDFAFRSIHPTSVTLTEPTPPPRRAVLPHRKGEEVRAARFQTLKARHLIRSPSLTADRKLPSLTRRISGQACPPPWHPFPRSRAATGSSRAPTGEGRRTSVALDWARSPSLTANRRTPSPTRRSSDRAYQPPWRPSPRRLAATGSGGVPRGGRAACRWRAPPSTAPSRSGSP